MKRLRRSLMLTIFMLLIGVTFNVKAASFDYYITNSNNYEPINNNEVKKIQRGDTITVTAMLLNLDNVTDLTIKSGKLTIRWDEKYFELKEVNGKYYNDSITDINGLTIGDVNKSSNKIILSNISSTGTLKDKLNKLVEFKFQVLGNATSGEAKIYQMDGEDSLECINKSNETEGTEQVAIKCGDSLLSELKYSIEKSKVNTLSSVKVNGKELEFFNENTFSYDLGVEPDVDKITIEVTKKDERSTISGNYGENPVKYGDNKYVINVISESGERSTYTFNVTREDARSNDNSLSTLTISSGEIDFKPDVLEYSINVENEVDKLTIKATLNDSKAKFVDDYKEKTIVLNEGSNKVEIKVISEKGDEKVYILNFNRALSSNNSLKSLKVNDEKVELKENEFIYNIILENEVEEVVIKAETNDPKATVDLKDKYPLEVGDNEIKITVTAASGANASYIININRKKLLSEDSLLSSLKIKGYDIDFKASTTLYNLKIDDKDEELEITATPEDENATVEIEGNKDLENGSIIKIHVKAENGNTTRYFINIEKGSAGISPVIIVIGVLFLLLAACIGIIFYRKKKQEKKEFDKLDEEPKKVVDEEKNEEESVTEKEETVENNDETVSLEEPKEVHDEEVADNTTENEVKEDAAIDSDVTYSRVSRLENSEAYSEEENK